MRFVLIEQIVSERAAGRIEYHGGALRRFLLDQFVQHVEHAEHRAGRLASGIAERRQRVKCAIQIRRAVDQEQFAGAHEFNGPCPTMHCSMRATSRSRPSAQAARNSAPGRRPRAERAPWMEQAPSMERASSMERAPSMERALWACRRFGSGGKLRFFVRVLRVRQHQGAFLPACQHECRQACKDQQAHRFHGISIARVGVRQIARNF